MCEEQNGGVQFVGSAKEPVAEYKIVWNGKTFRMPFVEFGRELANLENLVEEGKATIFNCEDQIQITALENLVPLKTYGLVDGEGIEGLDPETFCYVGHMLKTGRLDKYKV